MASPELGVHGEQRPRRGRAPDTLALANRPGQEERRSRGRPAGVAGPLSGLKHRAAASRTDALLINGIDGTLERRAQCTVWCNLVCT